MNTNVNGGAVGLFSLDALNVNTELGSVALEDLANLLSLEVTTGNLNLIVLNKKAVSSKSISGLEKIWRVFCSQNSFFI